jgi:hypothetical protein
LHIGDETVAEQIPADAQPDGGEIVLGMIEAGGIVIDYAHHAVCFVLIRAKAVWFVRVLASISLKVTRTRRVAASVSLMCVSRVDVRIIAISADLPLGVDHAFFTVLGKLATLPFICSFTVAIELGIRSVIVLDGLDDLADSGTALV